MPVLDIDTDGPTGVQQPLTNPKSGNPIHERREENPAAAHRKVTMPNCTIA